MSLFRNRLLETFGIEDNYTAIVNADIQLQHSNESEPFAEIVVDQKGNTTLRVGKLAPSKNPIVKIR